MPLESPFKTKKPYQDILNLILFMKNGFEDVGTKILYPPPPLLSSAAPVGGKFHN